MGSLVPAAGSPQPAAGGRTGTLYFLRDGPSDSTLSTLDQSTGAPTVVLDPSGAIGITLGLTESGDPDLLYGSRPGELLDIPTDGSPSTASGVTTVMEGLAWSPTNATLYATNNSQLAGGFFTWTRPPARGARTARAPAFGSRASPGAAPTIASTGSHATRTSTRTRRAPTRGPSSVRRACPTATGRAWRGTRSPTASLRHRRRRDPLLDRPRHRRRDPRRRHRPRPRRRARLRRGRDAGEHQATPCGTVQVATAAGGITNLSAVPVPATPALPAGVGSFPCGLVRFDVVGLMAGSSATITLTLPAGISPDSYWKLQHGAWSRVTGAQISGTSPRTITFTLTDGGPFDADGTANGTIVDPGGPAVASTAVTPIVVTPRFAG